MSEIRKWLEATGLGQYADAFEANKIEWTCWGKSMTRFSTSACLLQAIGSVSGMRSPN